MGLITAATRHSEFDKINSALDRAEFALEKLRKKVVALHRTRDLASTPEEIAALNLEATEVLQQLRKISDGVSGPSIRLVPDIE